MATEAEKVVIDVLARAQGFNTIKQSASSFGGDMDRIRTAASKAEQAIDKSMVKTSQSMNRVAQQSRNLGYQISDIGTQLSSGTSPFLILAQQGPQVANALDGAKGKLGQFATFLSGPWGAAMLAATTILGVFLTKTKDSADSVDDLVAKLKEQAQKTRDAEQANELFGRTLEGVTKAADEAEKAIEALRLAEKGEAEQTVETIKKDLEAAAALREKARARLADAKAILAIRAAEAERSAANPDELIGRELEASRQSKLVREIEAELNKADAAAKRLGKSFATAVSFRTVEQENASAAEKIDRKYDAMIDKAALAADASKKAQDELRKEIQRINEAREAELKRLRDTERERKRSGASLPQVTGKEVAGLIGAPITSGTRSAAQNRAAKGAANSYHLSGQAIDIPLTVNGKPLTKEGIRAALEPAGIAIKELLGPGDKGHDDHFHIAFDKKRLGPDEVAKAREKAEQKIAQQAEQEAERLARVANENASLDAVILRKKQDLAASAAQEAALEIESIRAAQAQYEAELAHLVATGKVTKAEAEILQKKSAVISDLDRQLVQRREEQRVRAENLQIAQGLIDNNLDLLRSEEGLATSQKERRRIALAILDAEYEKLRLVLEDQIKQGEINGISDERLKVMRAQLANLQTLKGNATESATKETAGPLEAYINDIEETAGAIDEAFEAIAVGSLQSVVDGLGQAAAGFTSLGDVGRSVLAQLTASLVKLAAQQLILKVLGETIGGSVNQTAQGVKSAGQAATAGAGAVTAATVAQAATAAAAWAPAAAAASLATLGANAGPAASALLTTHALSLALSAASGALKLAGGGPVHGPGGPTADKVPLWGSNGEYMIKAKSAAKLGRGFLDHVNRTGEAPAMLAGGGAIGRTVQPVNAPAAPGRSGGGEISEASMRRLESVVARAAASMPNVGLYAGFDPAEVLDRALGSPAGERRIIAWMGQNSGKINSQLRR